ncbi:MAG: hypothetical protein LC745_04245 [Planctomycetia bacterium]|nr:hypothetical protein [Planctomycetia bacterium]
MSDSQTAWTMLWDRAARGLVPGSPFEIGEAAPDVARALKISDADARKLIGGLLTELDRMPEGRRYFAREGDAVVPLPEFKTAHNGSGSALDAYPYEL